jgi:glycine/D-amino acid oxidase-like deaminating enzyme
MAKLSLSENVAATTEGPSQGASPLRTSPSSHSVTSPSARCSAAEVVPGLGRLAIARSWAGFEGATPDALPLFGRLPGQDHVFIAACCPGGFTQGPIFGRLMAELVTTGQTSMTVAPFDPGRFG